MIACRVLRGLSSLSIAQRILTRQVHGVLEGGEDEVTSIHPTAVFHPDAVLGKGVIIGPFCTVGSAVKIGNACQLYPTSHVTGDTKLGEHCVVLTGAIIGADLPGRTIIGSNNVSGHHAVVGVKCQDLKYRHGDECFLHVGDNNDIREYVSIHRSSKSSDKMDYTHTAGATVVHQFCHIGSYSSIGGLMHNPVNFEEGVLCQRGLGTSHIYMMVSGVRAERQGLNSEGLHRYGFSSMEVRSMRKAYQKIFMPSDANSRGFEDRLSEVEQNEELAEFPVVRSMVQSICDSFEQSR